MSLNYPCNFYLDPDEVPKIMLVPYPETLGTYFYAILKERAYEKKCTLDDIKKQFDFNNEELDSVVNNLVRFELGYFVELINPANKEKSKFFHFKNGLSICDECKFYDHSQDCWLYTEEEESVLEK